MSAWGSRQTHRSYVAAERVSASVAVLAAGVGTVDPAGYEYGAPGAPTTDGSFSGHEPNEALNGVDRIRSEQSVGIAAVGVGAVAAVAVAVLGETLGSDDECALDGAAAFTVGTADPVGASLGAASAHPARASAQITTSAGESFIDPPLCLTEQWPCRAPPCVRNSSNGTGSTGGANRVFVYAIS